MAYDLKGKVVLITGGAIGIGFSCTKELLRNGVQAVTIVDVNSVNGEEAIKQITAEFGANRAIFVKTDVTKADQLEAAFKASINTWKTIDIVINNAGIMNDGQWELEISLNCNALVQGTFIGLQHMSKEKGGKGGIIVNLSSIFGLEGCPLLPVYVGTKHFVVGFSRSLGTAYHYNRTGVKILTMCPGPTDTSLITESVKFPSDISPVIKKDLAHSAANHPLQSAENVARGMVDFITKGESGSIWVAENNEPVYEAHIPPRQTFKKE